MRQGRHLRHLQHRPLAEILPRRRCVVRMLPRPSGGGGPPSSSPPKRSPPTSWSERQSTRGPRAKTSAVAPHRSVRHSPTPGFCVWPKMSRRQSRRTPWMSIYQSTELGRVGSPRSRPYGPRATIARWETWQFTHDKKPAPPTWRSPTPNPSRGPNNDDVLLLRGPDDGEHGTGRVDGASAPSPLSPWGEATSPYSAPCSFVDEDIRARRPSGNSLPQEPGWRPWQVAPDGQVPAGHRRRRLPRSPAWSTVSAPAATADCSRDDDVEARLVDVYLRQRGVPADSVGTAHEEPVCGPYNHMVSVPAGTPTRWSTRTRVGSTLQGTTRWPGPAPAPPLLVDPRTFTDDNEVCPPTEWEPLTQEPVCGPDNDMPQGPSGDRSTMWSYEDNGVWLDLAQGNADGLLGPTTRSALDPAGRSPTQPRCCSPRRRRRKASDIVAIGPVCLRDAP